MDEASGQAGAGWRAKRIGIVGAGAMGTTLAAVLGERVPVVMVCRNAQRAGELFEHGAAVEGAVHARSNPTIVRSVAELASLGGVSALFVATKTTAIPAVAADIKPHLDALADQHAGLYTVSFQNGIDPGRALVAALECDRVLRMVLNFGATLDPGRGVVRAGFVTPPHWIGGLGPTPAAGELASLLTSCGFDTRTTDDIESIVWQKAVLNASMNPVAALVNATVGVVLDSPARRLVEQLLREAIAVADAEHLALGEHYLERAWSIYDSAREHLPSMVEDIRLGRESEVGQLNKQIIAHGERVGVDAPTHRMVNDLIETFDWQVYHRAHAHGPQNGQPAG
jgi:2-dehydropantoate 2-reductase